MHPLIGVLIYVVIVLVLVWAAIWVIGETLPPRFHMIAKVVVGVIGLIAILVKLLPMAGV